MSRLDEYAKLQQDKRTNKIIIPIVKEHLLSQWDQRDHDPYHVHPSEMCKKDWCERATWHRVQTGDWKREATKFNFVLQSIFDEGHQIHDKWQQWLRGSGKLWGDWKCLSCNEEFTGRSDQLVEGWYDATTGHTHVWKYEEVTLISGIIAGHEDGAIDDRLVEFKSVGIGTLRADSPALLAKYYNKHAKLYDLDSLWKMLGAPFKSHVKQANIYMWLAREMYGASRFPKCSIVYEFKPNQQSKEFVVPLSAEIVEPLIERAQSVQNDTPPPCPFRGCKYCRVYEDPEPSGLQNRRSVASSSVRSKRAEPARTEEASQRSTRSTPRRNRTKRQCPDEAIQGTDGLAEVPGDATGPSGNRRRTLVKKRKDAGDEI